MCILYCLQLVTRAYSDVVDLGLELYVEFLVYTFFDLLGQSNDVGWCCVILVHQYEGLPLIDCGTTMAMALHATLFDEPCGRHFDLTLVDRIVWHARISAQQANISLNGDDGVLEETACAAQSVG